MSTELAGIIAMLVCNIVGWGIILWKSNLAQASASGSMKTTIKDLQKDMGELPCKRQTDYIENVGAVRADIKSINSRLTRIENKIFNGG